MSDTPETDEAMLPDDIYQLVWADFARKLERERNEAREKAERYRLEANAMMLQRDESREALREIAEASGFDNIGNWARNKAKSALYR